MPIQPFVINKENGLVHHKVYRIFLHTLLNFHEFINTRTAKYDEYWTLYTLLTIKNHMTLSLLTVYSVKCQFLTIRDISMDFGYGTGCTQ